MPWRVHVGPGFSGHGGEGWEKKRGVDGQICEGNGVSDEYRMTLNMAHHIVRTCEHLGTL